MPSLPVQRGRRRALRMHDLRTPPCLRLHFLSAAARRPVVVRGRGTPAPDGGGGGGGGGGGAQSSIPGVNSSAPMSRAGVSGQGPGVTRGSPAMSIAPSGGAAGVPWSMKAPSQGGWRWESGGGAVGATEVGSASVWKVWHEFPVVVGPAEKVIVQLVGTFGFWAIDEVTMLESTVRAMPLSWIAGLLPIRSAFVTVRPAGEP